MAFINETIYYQEREDFHPQSVFSDGPVSVRTGMLRVGNDTYTLLGVNSSKLSVELQQPDHNRREIKRWQFGVNLFYLIAFVAGVFNHYLFALVLVAIALYVLYEHQLGKAEILDEVQRCYIATIVLHGVEGETSVVIGKWAMHIDDLLGSKMVRVGYSKNDVSRYNEQSIKERNRAEAIANAVGSAIVHGAMVNRA